MNSQRMCVVCRQMKSKEQLVRVVRTVDGMSIDPTFKAQGRGAYICRAAECVSKARRLRAFERSFSGRVDALVYDGLEDLIKNA